MFLSLFILGVVGNTVSVSGFTNNFKHFFVKKNTQKLNENTNNQHYPYSNQYFEQYLKRLNSKNISTQHQSILGNHTNPKPNKYNKPLYELDDDEDYDDDEFDYDDDEDENYPTPIFILTPQRQRQRQGQVQGQFEPHTRRKNKYSTNNFSNVNSNNKKNKNPRILKY